MAEKLVQILNKAGNGFNNEIQRLSSKWKEMYAIEERADVDEEQKMIFENDVDKEYYMGNLMKFNVEKKLLTKLMRLEKRWLKNKKCTAELVKGLSASHETFSKNVRVESFEKPGPRILNIKRHNHKAVWKSDDELEALKNKAAEKYIEKEEKRKADESAKKAKDSDKSKEDKTKRFSEDSGSKKKSEKNKAGKSTANVAMGMLVQVVLKM